MNATFKPNVVAEAGADSGGLLSVRDLSVSVPVAAGNVLIVDHVSFDLKKAERVALVGESGSGKSVLARAIMRLNDSYRINGRILLEEEDLTAKSEAHMRRVRGRRIGMVFQDAMTALDPIQPIGKQVMETLIIHGTPKRQARERAIAVLKELGVRDAAQRMNAAVHEFSGGMRQRVVIAMALIADPALLIADEPTTALDTRVQMQVLDLLDDISERRRLSVMLITHDMGVVASFADRVLVMYSGRIVEDAPVGRLFSAPLHPYSRSLLEAVPRIDHVVDRLPAVPGTPLPPILRPAGCAFHPRCALATDICRDIVPALRTLADSRRVACHHADTGREA
ncbi:ABC transporter ATP-binding protein [Pararhizobium sp. O133]|uniref:ABC transporter ATP-binding protein n=1 Tax=Pararhizobium sp. O133 TaxID=3449278 RepID=UPI003F684CC5